MTDRAETAALSRWGFRGAVAALIGFGLVFIARGAISVDGVVHFSLFDDAMISMRYAQNLANGDGLVWNPGEPGVEGYTNFAWTLWMALLHVVGISPAKLGLAVSLTSLGLLAANLFALRALARELVPNRPYVATIAAWLSVASYGLLYWSLRGMEVGLITLLVTVAALLGLRMARGDTGLGPWAAAVVVVGVLTRTDVAVLLGAVGLGTLIAAPRERRLSIVAWWALPAVATLAIHTAVRVRWYGDALPNTYYLKVAGTPLSDRLDRGLATAGLRLASGFGLMIAGVIGAALLDHAPRRRWAPVALPVLTAFGYAVYVGGDAWEWMGYANRYLAPVVPLAALASAWALDRVAASASARGPLLIGAAAVAALGLGWLALGAAPVAQVRDDQASNLQDAVLAAIAIAIAGLVVAALSARNRNLAISASLATALAALLAFPGLAGWWSDGGEHVKTDRELTAQGVALRETLPADTSIAVVWAGTLPYFSELPAIDLLGKSDRVIAHAPPSTDEFFPGHTKWDYERSIGEAEPDIVIGIWKQGDVFLRYIERGGYLRIGDRFWVAPEPGFEIGRLDRVLDRYPSPFSR